MHGRRRRRDAAFRFIRSAAVLGMLLAGALAAAGARADAASEAVTPPPGARPIPIEVGFYLLNLVSVDERSETFEADVYLDLVWKDPRLGFEPKPGEPAFRTFLGDAAGDRLVEIWWPDLEFVNTASPDITNRTLYIRSDGTVRYRLGLSGVFRTSLDLRRFPFDEQVLDIRLQSFEGDAELLVFEPESMRMGYNARDDFAGLTILGVSARTETSVVEGWNEQYSELVIEIAVQRSPSFFLWTVFLPVALVLLLSATIFFVDIEGFHDRVAISLACFLACVATQFAMSFNLPRISYLTPIDRLFLVTYGCMSLGVAVSVWQKARLRNHPELVERTDRIAAVSIPILYAALLFFVVLP